MTSIVKVPEILLPAQSVDLAKWATVACDQFCAEPKYWQTLEAYVADSPSTLRLVIPEIFLNGDLSPRAKCIHDTMNKYIQEGLLVAYHGFILVERQFASGKKRIGLMLSFDLEAYDWKRVRVPIRATEDTILSRLPARVEIRNKAPIELPHALLLIDDQRCEIIDNLYAQRRNLSKLYDFELNMDGGRITGYAVGDNKDTISKLEGLLEPALQTQKYGRDAGILFAIGDGNHSLAAAKMRWDEVKKTLSPQERQDHPARYMLAEAVNIYGDGMDFLPIHRFIYNTDGKEFIDGLKSSLGGKGSFEVITREGKTVIGAPQDAARAITEIQDYIECYIAAHPGAKVEYVHSASHLEEVIAARGGTGIFMPLFPQDGLFDYVVNVGNLPKKAFSIGEPEEKRYYLEAKKIVC